MALVGHVTEILLLRLEQPPVARVDQLLEGRLPADGVGVFGVISICIFFTFFIGMLIWVISLKKTYLNSMRNLPLDGGSAPQTSSTSNSNPELP